MIVCFGLRHFRFKRSNFLWGFIKCYDDDIIFSLLNICRYSIAEANSSQGLMNTLTISSLTRDDGGDYSCIASNKYGSSSLRVQLSVFGKFESFEEKKQISNSWVSCELWRIIFYCNDIKWPMGTKQPLITWEELLLPPSIPRLTQYYNSIIGPYS